MLQRVKEVQESDLRMVGALARNIQRVLPVSQADIDAAAALGKGWVVWKVIEVTDPIDNLRGGTQLVIKQNSITPGQNVRRVLIVSGPGGETVVIGPGPSPLLLPSAVANSLSYVKAFGGTSQASTPTPDTPMDIVSNNGVLKYGQYGKNLFDLNTMDTHHGWWVNGSVINDTPSANRTIVIDCRPNTVYSFWHTEGAGGCRAFALNKDTIASGDTASWLTYGSPTFQAKDVVTKIKTPADAKKLYILAGRTEGAITRSFEEQLADFMVVEGEVEAALPYEPYHFGIHTDGTVETISAHGKNLFDKNASYALFSGYLNNVLVGQNTILNAYNGGDKTIIIKVVPNTTYTVTRATNLGSVYDRIRCAAFTTLPSNNSTGVMLCNYMKTTQANATFTTLSDTQYVAINVRNSGTVGDDWTQFVDAFQLERGSTATEYAPYYDGGTATAEMLLKVGNYQDVQSIIDGVVTRNVGVKVLDGTEAWGAATTSGVRVFMTNLIGGYQYPLICTHFINGEPTTDNIIYIASGTQILHIRYDTAPDVAGFKQWLADQYAAGTPVIVVYPLETPTTESVAGQTLQVQAGDNTLTITQASLTGLELEAKFEKSA